MIANTSISIAAACLSISATISSAQSAAAQTDNAQVAATPSDVYREVQSVADDIEHIRVYLGRPTNTQTPIDVSGVTPREVIYQASTLCAKVNRLGFETIRETTEKPVVPSRKIVPADVLRIVRFTHERTRRIAEKLNLELSSQKPDPSNKRTPTDVYKAIVQLNRQVNLLLDKRFSPSEVYAEVTVAIAHAANLRSRWPGDRIPPAPKWELGKRPADVLMMLAKCFEQVRSIAKAEGLEILQYRLDKTNLKAITPSDVHDVAALLVSELAYLDRTLVKTKTPRKARYPGRKVPSDVYQRAGILMLQLDEIKRLSSKNATRGGS